MTYVDDVIKLRAALAEAERRITVERRRADLA